MKNTAYNLGLPGLMILIVFGAKAQEIYPRKAAPIEDNCPIEFPCESKYFEYEPDLAQMSFENGRGTTDFENTIAAISTGIANFNKPFLHLQLINKKIYAAVVVNE